MDNLPNPMAGAVYRAPMSFTVRLGANCPIVSGAVQLYSFEKSFMIHDFSKQRTSSWLTQNPQKRGGSPGANGKLAPVFQDGWKEEDRYESTKATAFVPIPVGTQSSFFMRLTYEWSAAVRQLHFFLFSREHRERPADTYISCAGRGSLAKDKSSSLVFSKVAEPHIGGNDHEHFKWAMYIP